MMLSRRIVAAAVMLVGTIAFIAIAVDNGAGPTAPSATSKYGPWTTSIGNQVETQGELSDVAAAAMRKAEVTAWNEYNAQTERTTARLASTSVGPSQTLDGQLVGGPAGYGKERFALALVRELPSIGGQPAQQRLEVRTGQADKIDGTIPVATAATITAGPLAVSPRGDFAIAWVECPSKPTCHQDPGLRLRVAVRPAGGSFGRLRTLPEPYSEDADLAALAFNTRGDLLLAYSDDDAGVIVARVRQVGRDFGRPQALGRHDGTFSGPIRAAMSTDGHLAVAWGTKRIRSAIRLPNAARFRRAQILDRYALRGRRLDPELPVEPDIELVLTGDGSAIVTWRHNTQLRVAATNGAGRFGSARTLSRSYSPPHHLASDMREDVMVVFFERAHTRLVARLRIRANAFAPAEPIPRGASASDFSAGFERRSRRPSIVWPARDGLHIAKRG